MDITNAFTDEIFREYIRLYYVRDVLSENRTKNENDNKRY